MQVLARLDEEIGRGSAVQCAARVIWVSQSGVSEHDLRSILSESSGLRTEDDFDEFRHRTRDIFVNHANMVTFVHGSLADAVEDSYFTSSKYGSNTNSLVATSRTLLISVLTRRLDEMKKEQKPKEFGDASSSAGANHRQGRR